MEVAASLASKEEAFPSLGSLHKVKVASLLEVDPCIMELFKAFIEESGHK
jgi:hypothetical protein